MRSVMKWPHWLTSCVALLIVTQQQCTYGRMYKCSKSNSLLQIFLKLQTCFSFSLPSKLTFWWPQKLPPRWIAYRSLPSHQRNLIEHESLLSTMNWKWLSRLSHSEVSQAFELSKNKPLASLTDHNHIQADSETDSMLVQTRLYSVCIESKQPNSWKALSRDLAYTFNNHTQFKTWRRQWTV